MEDRRGGVEAMPCYGSLLFIFFRFFGIKHFPSHVPRTHRPGRPDRWLGREGGDILRDFWSAYVALTLAVPGTMA